MSPSFSHFAESILQTEIFNRVNSFGGYGINGEVIYDRPIEGCPSVLVSSFGKTVLSVMSNGSTEFKTRNAENKEIILLKANFDPVIKRETGVPSHNLWLRMDGESDHISSLLNNQYHVQMPAISEKVVKFVRPERAMCFVQHFQIMESVVAITLQMTPKGPALLRKSWIRNHSSKTVSGQLWSYFAASGTQFFNYNKDNWYDIGLPISDSEIIVSASVPYSELLQIKRFSSGRENLNFSGNTCDYQTFVGGSSSTALLPWAVRNGRFSEFGAQNRMNRFSTPNVAACSYKFRLASGESAKLEESMCFISDSELIAKFRKATKINSPCYSDVSRAFQIAAEELCQKSLSVQQILHDKATVESGNEHFYHLHFSSQKAISEYANSVWTGVEELYENCRAHGAQLGDGIEIGTRDRGQDMWAKMRHDPTRIREDLIYVLSLMIITGDGIAPKQISGKRMSLEEKLYGTFPRQYPSVWLDRNKAVQNDNRPYADSPLWLLNALVRYLKETGDCSILQERVGTVRLLNPQDPIHSGMIGNSKTLTIEEVVFEIIESFERMANDTPYGMAQILYGDWCDPVDMFGTSVVGDAATRGHGRGVGVRLSLHLFETLIDIIDQFEPLRANFIRLEKVKEFALCLRGNSIKWGFEEDGFVDAIHEYRRNGSTPDYASGEKGYTLGSMRGTDFDGMKRRVATPNAYGLFLLTCKRKYLPDLDNKGKMLQGILNYVDRHVDAVLGLPLYSCPISNSEESVKLVGRMGLIPAGTAENGEYHHGQMFMHYFRSLIPGQEDHAFNNFLPVMSASRKDEFLGGPFDTPSTSYAADKDDPHYGMGMYFGLSGSTVWILEYFEKMIGLELNLADPTKSDLVVTPRIPLSLEGEIRFDRTVHIAIGPGVYRKLSISIRLQGKCLDSYKIESLKSLQDETLIIDLSQEPDSGKK